MRSLEFKQRAKLIITHVLGERMKVQETNVTFRGQLKEGITTWEAMLSFCPEVQSVLEIYQSLEIWVLTPKNGFSRGHQYSYIYNDVTSFGRLNTSQVFFYLTPSSSSS